jgi:acetoin utilization deacetylase AcuC-like enzyme
MDEQRRWRRGWERGDLYPRAMPRTDYTHVDRFPDHAEGFCYVHDMAIAVERFRSQGRLGKVLFVDVDLHQGNGTAVIYRSDENTYTYSIHQEKNYPLKQRSNLDRGLDDGVGDEQYLECLQDDLDAIDHHFEPQFVCFVAGVDPFKGDRLGRLALSAEGLRRRDQLVLDRFVGRDEIVSLARRLVTVTAVT